MTNLAQNLLDSAARDGDHIAIKLGEHTMSYAQLDALSARAAKLLQDRGLQPGDRVGIMLPNVPAFPVAYYGVLRAAASSCR